MFHGTGWIVSQVRVQTKFSNKVKRRFAKSSLSRRRRSVLNVKALVDTFHQEKALVGAFSVIRVELRFKLYPNLHSFHIQNAFRFCNFSVFNCNIFNFCQHTTCDDLRKHLTQKFHFIHFVLVCKQCAKLCNQKKDQSWPIYYRISNKLLDAEHDLEVESRISNNNKLFQSFHDALIRKWTSYTFLNISPSVNILTGGCSNPAESTTCSYHQGKGGINCKIIYKLSLAHLMI